MAMLRIMEDVVFDVSGCGVIKDDEVKRERERERESRPAPQQCRP